MNKSVEKLMNKVIISVQAYEDTPLYGPVHMQAMAQSVLMGGADGIRACWPQDIRAIREITDKPIVGIYKDFPKKDPLDSIYITPTFERACEVIDAGADILGIDCTLRPDRDLKELTELLARIKDKYPDTAIMADLATFEEGVQVAETGLVDIISTTLNGYTRESLDQKTDAPNTELIRRLKQHIQVPVNGEGRVWTLEDMGAMLDAGADMVTIGSAVTRPHLITERFIKYHEQWKANQ